MARKDSRVRRWYEAARRAQEALSELVEVQEEYEAWKENAEMGSEGLTHTATYAKLEEVYNLDLREALSTAEEAAGLDLPLGFGRD